MALICLHGRLFVACRISLCPSKAAPQESLRAHCSSLCLGPHKRKDDRTSLTSRHTPVSHGRDLSVGPLEAMLSVSASRQNVLEISCAYARIHRIKKLLWYHSIAVSWYHITPAYQKMLQNPQTECESDDARQALLSRSQCPRS